MGKSKPSVKKSIIIVVAAIVIVAVLGAGCALQSYTLVQWWLPVTIAMVITMMLWPIFNTPWARFIKHILPRGIVHATVVTAVLWTLILAINMWGSNHTTTKTEQVTVTRVLRYERHQTRRSGRRFIRTDKVRYEYRAEVELPDEQFKKELHINNKQALTLKKGQRIDIQVSKGLFGWPVISYNIVTARRDADRMTGSDRIGKKRKNN